MDTGPKPPSEGQETHAADTILTTPQDMERLAWVERLATASIRDHATVIAGLNE